MVDYDGPVLSDYFNDLPFCTNLIPTDGFIKAEFVKIADGDTAFFKINGITESVRFMVVDTPKHIVQAGDDSMIEPLGPEATAYSETILKNAKEIYLESDSGNNLRDDTTSKRLLAWIWCDGKLLNYMLVKKGYAFNHYIITEKMKYLDIMRKAEVDAKNSKLGIFKDV